VNKDKPTYQDLEKRLAASEPVIEALKHHEVDAVVGEKKISFLLLREVTEALRSSEAGFRAMFELYGVGMFQADTPAFRFTRVNPKFCEIMGYSPEELLAKTYIGLTLPQDRKHDMNALTQVLRGKTDSWSVEKRCVRKDGSIVWVDVNGAALRDETGRTVRIMAMISDVTARKQREEELKKGIEQRTAELTHTIKSLRTEAAKRKLAEQVLRDRWEKLRKLASELTVAERREQQRIARILSGNKRRKSAAAKSTKKARRKTR